MYVKNFVRRFSGNSDVVFQLFKPTCFALAAGASTFFACVKWRRMKRTSLRIERPRTRVYPSKPSDPLSLLKRRLSVIRSHWDGLERHKKVVGAIIAANTAIFLMWRIPRLAAGPLTRWFAATPVSSFPGAYNFKPTCWPMLLSNFSHKEAWHFGIHMYILWNFSPIGSEDALTVEQFLALFLCAGLSGNWSSYICQCFLRSPGASVGASACIMGLIPAAALLFPDSRFSIVGLDLIYPHSFSAKQAMVGLASFDSVGLLLTLMRGYGFFHFDHAGHLGGLLFGFLYMRYGERIFRDLVRKSKS